MNTEIIKCCTRVLEGERGKQRPLHGSDKMVQYGAYISFKEVMCVCVYRRNEALKVAMKRKEDTFPTYRLSGWRGV